MIKLRECRYKMLLLLLICIKIVYAENTHQNCYSGCYYADPDFCLDLEKGSHCKLAPDCNKAIICCNLSSSTVMDELVNASEIAKSNKVSSLHILRSEYENFTLKFNDWWRDLRSFAFTHGSINKFLAVFPKMSKTLTCLNLTSNGIIEFRNDSLTKLTNITTLDLSHNNLTVVPIFRKGIRINLDVSDNKKLQCNDLQETIVNRGANLSFINSNNTVCETKSKERAWFNSTEQLPFNEVEKLALMMDKCPVENCTCKAHRAEYKVPGDALSISLAIDCFNKSLTDLPSPLPEGTIKLNISHNNISSLKTMIEDPTYENLRILDAAHNNITSIFQLESSKFISNFVVLNLRHNNIKTLPPHLFLNNLDRNSERFLSLGQNRLECDCNTAKNLKLWLLSKHILDYEEIFCENTGKKVLDLDPSELCQNQQDWTDYIYYIIAAEILMFVGLIAKVSYDYWVFKSAGYLPWPASKMPKLPCDCLCEH